jgi:type IV pilus assembly protein PilP
MNNSEFHCARSRLWLIVIAAVSLSACNGDMTELEMYIADVKDKPAQPIPPIPPVKTYTPYIYEGITGRDPFRSSTSEGSDETVSASGRSGPKPDINRPKEYLEQFELDTLEMVGTFAKGDDFWGLVRDPDGVVHRVAVNNYMGKNHGRVTYVQDAELGLSELITDGMGGWLVRDASMALDEG